MAITSSFSNLATVTRASKKTDAGGWDFTDGGIVGTLSEFASGVAAIHPTAGLLIEQSATNLIRNPRCEGASGSTPPTYWSVAAAGLTITYETVSINGWPGVRITLSGTASGNLQFIADSGYTPSSQTDVFTASAGIILEAGSLPTGFEFGLQHRIAGSLAESDAAAITGADSSHRRYFRTGTVDTAGVDTTNWFMRAPSLAEAVSCTFVVLAPQLEESGYATSPILPDVGSPAASTRAADDISVASGAWLGSTEHTLLVEWAVNAAAIASDFSAAYLSDGTYTSRLSIAAKSDRTNVRLGGYTPTANFNTNIVSSPLPSPGQYLKAAVAYAVNDAAMSAQGGTQVTDTSTGTLATLTALNLGKDHTANTQANVYIKELRYWPRRLSNAELEALVGN